MTYGDLHFFIDESGRLEARKKRDVRLVGGLLLFGPYDQGADGELLACLKRRVPECGGKFPEALHVSQSGLDRQAMARLMDLLQGDLANQAGRKYEVQGVSIAHTSDMFAEGPAILSEVSFDNRYVSMLWSLVEHLVFVNPAVSAKLDPGARVHLHIAQRALSFGKDRYRKEDLEALGYKVYEDNRRENSMFVPGTLREREVLGMFRMALRQRWPKPNVDFGEVRMEWIDYKARGRSEAGLYLADLHLGQVRRDLQGPASNRLPALFRDEVRLDYGPQLELLAEMKSAVMQDDLDLFERHATGLDAAPELPSELSGVLKGLTEQAAKLTKAAPERVTHLIEAAGRQIDLPGGAEAGMRRLRRGLKYLAASGQNDLRTEVLALQARLSYHNHRGDSESAAGVWGAFLELESMLPSLGLEGLRLAAELRNRRAVSLTDAFDHDGAMRVLGELVSTQEDLRGEQARLFGLPVDRVRITELGACYGSLGQLHAFRGTPETVKMAQICFRRAMEHFVEPEDKERQWVYLGHLACDRGEAGAEDFREVEDALPELRGPEPVARAAGQYILALQVKGKLLFASPAELAEFLKSWKGRPPHRSYEAAQTRLHPFGLIHQCIARCHERMYREDRKQKHHAELALEDYAEAANLMQAGGGLLKALGIAALLRQYALLSELNPKNKNYKQLIRSSILQMKGHLAEQYGEFAWREEEDGAAGGVIGAADPGPGTPATDRAPCIAGAFRFNYW